MVAWNSIRQRNNHHRRGQNVALAAALSLSLLPVAAGAQIIRSQPQQLNVPPAVPPAPMVRPLPPVYRPPMGPPPIYSMPGRPLMPGNYGFGGPYGSMFNRSGVDFNSIFRRMQTNPGMAPPGGNQGNPFDPGGLTFLNDPSLLTAPNPIDPGGLTHLNDPSLLVKPSPIDPGRLMQLNSPSVQAGISHFQEPTSFDRFSRSMEGQSFRYYNGQMGRGGIRMYGWWGATIFPGGIVYFPGYYPGFVYGATCPSLYGYYYGFPPYIGSDYTYNEPPQYVYVPYPVYQDGSYDGTQKDDVDSYYLNRPQDKTHYHVGEGDKKDTVLDAAITDITDAWNKGDIQLLAKHIRRDARIAVYLRGQYQYSLDSSDYLDMTRDALHATKTVSFKLDDVERKQNGIYAITGRHVYRDKGDNEHTVHVSYVLQKEDDEYYITQVGTAPDKLNENQ